MRGYEEPLDERLLWGKPRRVAWHDSRYFMSLCFHIDPLDW